MAGCGQSSNINLDPQAIIAPFEEAANIIKAKTGYYILGKDTVAYVISILPRIGQAIMGGISSFAVNIFVLVFVLYFMLIGGKRWNSTSTTYCRSMMTIHKTSSTKST